MKLFSVAQIKAWDAFTIHNEPVKSIDLMERAAMACFNWIIQFYSQNAPIKVFCGEGNNGGDGLVLARYLCGNKYNVSVYIIKTKKEGSPDFEANLKRLKKSSAEIVFLAGKDGFPLLTKEDIIIDALLGTGLNKQPDGLIAEVIHYINAAKSKVISIDVPAGLFLEKSSVNNDRPRPHKRGPSIIKATFTLTFQNQKLAFLLPENEPFVGKVSLLDIGLAKEFEEKEACNFKLIDKKIIEKIYTPRNPFSHKGNYGYACLLAGSYGMMGAAVLSAKACLRSGIGNLTCYIPEAGYSVLQTSVPETMCKIFGEKFLKDVNDFKDFDVIGIGPGIGKHESHRELLQDLFTGFKKPLVIDADALNVLSENQDLYKSIPPNSIITPHPKEFERLFGKTESDFDRINLALSKAKELNIYIVLKGHHTFIAAPDGRGYFNSTGNAGMATAGAGDVLTGIITGLLGQKYSPLNSCILGVYLHGLAGDIAAKNFSEESLTAGDIIENLKSVFKENETNNIPE